MQHGTAPAAGSHLFPALTAPGEGRGGVFTSLALLTDSHVRRFFSVSALEFYLGPIWGQLAKEGERKVKRMEVERHAESLEEKQ